MFTALDHVSRTFGSINATYDIKLLTEYRGFMVHRIFQVCNTRKLRVFPQYTTLYISTHPVKNLNAKLMQNIEDYLSIYVPGDKFLGLSWQMPAFVAAPILNSLK
jgi:hypothetical protein